MGINTYFKVNNQENKIWEIIMKGEGLKYIQ